MVRFAEIVLGRRFHGSDETPNIVPAVQRLKEDIEEKEALFYYAGASCFLSPSCFLATPLYAHFGQVLKARISISLSDFFFQLISVFLGSHTHPWISSQCRPYDRCFYTKNLVAAGGAQPPESSTHKRSPGRLL